MRRAILIMVSAAALSAAVYAAETLPARDRGVPARASGQTVEQGNLALEVMENFIQPDGAARAQVVFVVVKNDDTLPQDGAFPPDAMATWQIQILDSSGRKVSFLQGKGGPPPPILAWTGTSGDGKPLPGGFYTARLVWKDKAEKAYASPAVSVNLFSELSMPRFAELNLDFRFAGGFPRL